MNKDNIINKFYAECIDDDFYKFLLKNADDMHKITAEELAIYWTIFCIWRKGNI